MKYSYNVSNIEEGLYRIAAPEGVFMELIVGDEKALLFDTGYGLTNVRNIISEITDKPLMIVNSHGHIDHAGGNYLFHEPTYMHPADFEVCQRHTGSEYRKIVLDIVVSASEQLGLELPQDMKSEEYIHSGMRELLPVTDGDQFDLGGKTIVVKEFSGHTKGSIGLFYVEKKILYVGDAISPTMWLFLPESSDLSTYKKTLDKIEAIDFVYMIQAHQKEKMTRENLSIYRSVANSIEWDKCDPFESPLPVDYEVRSYTAYGEENNKETVQIAICKSNI